MGKGKNATRRGARELAFQVLYGLSFTPAQTPEELRRAFVLSPHNTAMNEKDLSTEPTGFAWELVEGVWNNSEALDAAIGQFSRNWRVDRMGRIELTLLRLAVFEMLYRQDVPPKVGEGNAKNFINGILDAAAKALESDRLIPPVARAAKP